MKYFEFKTESKITFSAAAQRAQLNFIAYPTFKSNINSH